MHHVEEMSNVLMFVLQVCVINLCPLFNIYKKVSCNMMPLVPLVPPDLQAMMQPPGHCASHHQVGSCPQIMAD